MGPDADGLWITVADLGEGHRGHVPSGGPRGASGAKAPDSETSAPAPAP